MRPLLLVLLLRSAPAFALEKEFAGQAEGLVCYPYSADPELLVPFVKPVDYAGPAIEREQLALQSRALRVGRASAALDKALSQGCVSYDGSVELARQGRDLLKAVDAARLKAEEAWDSLNGSFELDRRPMRLSELEAALTGKEAAPGNLAETCRPAAVSSELLEPGAGQAKGKEEEEAFGKLSKEARRVSAHIKAMDAAFGQALRALEGEQCTELNKSYDGLMYMTRYRFVSHRSRTLGELWSRRLEFTPAP